MPEESEDTNAFAIDPGLMGCQLWEEIERLFVDWVNAARMLHTDGATRAEQQFRFIALVYASLAVDEVAVSTGRKAIVRSIYGRLGTADAANVLVMLDAAIKREEAVARRGAAAITSLSGCSPGEDGA